jgi:hypothetical protein
MSPQAASAIILLIAGVAFDVFCVRDLGRAEITYRFPPQVWLFLIVLGTPFGGLAYLSLGRRR